MQLHIYKKRLDTIPMKHLITQGETGVDRIAISLQRYYGKLDLAGLSFVMTGTAENRETINETLENIVSETVISVIWVIKKSFTQYSGLMNLELKGLDSEQSIIIKFCAEPIFIRPKLEVQNES